MGRFLCSSCVLFLWLVTGSFLVTSRLLHSPEDCATFLVLSLCALLCVLFLWLVTGSVLVTSRLLHSPEDCATFFVLPFVCSSFVAGHGVPFTSFRD